MLISITKRFFVVLLCGLAANAVAHRYFFSITDLTLHESKQSIEIIHQITAHDINNAIADTKKIHFSVAHPNYEAYIRQYIEANFKLSYQNITVPLHWVGLELNKGNILVYQETHFTHALHGLEITNSLLIERYLKQTKTVNFHNNKNKGILTFNSSSTVKTLVIKK